MKTIKNYLQFITATCILLASNISKAQILTGQIGVQYFGLNGSKYANSGFSPTIGFNYRFENSNLPVSIGLTANFFNIDMKQSHPIFSFIENKTYDFTFRNQLNFVQFQMPIAYHFDFRQSDLFIGISPTLYWKTKSSFDYQLQETDPHNLISYSKDASFNHPETLTANFDFSLGYNYFFNSNGKRRFGIQAKINYPLLKMQPIVTEVTRNLVYKNGDTETNGYKQTSNFTPYSIGLSLLVQ